MSDIGTLVDFTDGQVLYAAQLDSNFSAIRTAFNTYGVQTDKASQVITKTITFTPDAGVGFVVSTGGFAVTGNSTITGTLTGLTGITSSGTAAFADVTASGTLAVTGTSTLGATNTGALTCTTFTPSGLAQAGGQAARKRYYAGNSGSAITIDWNNGNDQVVTMTANCAFTFSNAVVGAWYTLELLQDGSGSKTHSYAAGTTVVWPDAVAPTLTTTANRKDVLSYKCVSASSGGTYLGSVYGQNFNNTTT
jgi:hypothetical protein